MLEMASGVPPQLRCTCMSPAYHPLGSGPDAASVMRTDALFRADTFRAASSTQAYSVLLPAVAKVYAAGTVAVHSLAVGDGVALDSLTR